jgi:ElaA protein
MKMKQKEPITWSVLQFDDLSVNQLFDVLQLRNQIFIVEQNCPYLDLDLKDQKCFHVMGYNNLGQLMATSRVLPAGISYPEVSLGRVAVALPARGFGIGDELNRKSLDFIIDYYGDVPVRLSAQKHLSNFYKKHGFSVVSDPYDEDGIPHVEMLYLPYQ